MRFSDIFLLSFNALNERKVRTGLTIMMVVIGSSLMIVLNGLSAGQSEFLETQLDSFASNVLTVTPGQNSFQQGGSSVASMVFTSTVVNKINALPFVTEVVPQYTGSVSLNSQGNVITASVIAMEPEKILTIFPNLEMKEESSIRNNDPIAMLVGGDVAQPAGSPVPLISIGQTIKATFAYTDDEDEFQEDTRVFTVSGILESTGDRQIDNGIIISENVGNQFLQKSNKFDSMLVVAESSEYVGDVEQYIKNLYGNSIGVSSLTASLQVRNDLTSGNDTFISSVGLIALVVGAVGIITTLYTSVMERTKEIGTMKAIGAQNSSILLLFLVEALLIGVLGGTLGIVIGVGAGFSLSSFLSPPAPGGSSEVAPIFRFEDLFSIWILSVGLSIAAGLYPAWKASKMSPLLALRRE